MQIARGGGGEDVGGNCCHEISVSKAHSSFSMRPSKDVSACNTVHPLPTSAAAASLSPFPLSLLSSTPENEMFLPHPSEGT